MTVPFPCTPSHKNCSLSLPLESMRKVEIGEHSIITQQILFKKKHETIERKYE